MCVCVYWLGQGNEAEAGWEQVFIYLFIYLFMHFYLH